MKNNILAVQFEPRVSNKQKNYEIIESLIEQNKDKKLDLILFPEFFSTGISHNAFVESFEVEDNSESIEFASKLAKKFDSNICMGTIIEKENDKLYNTLYVLDRSGNIVSKYRKIHLFSYFGGNEDEIITKGDMPVVSELDFAVVGLSICFDIRFPIHFNKLIKMGAEIIICPNAWCVPKNLKDEMLNLKLEEMKSFMIARASENLVYFIASSMSCNVGSGLISASNSAIISPLGEVLSYAKDKNQIVTSEIDLSIVRKFKKEFPVYKMD